MSSPKTLVWLKPKFLGDGVMATPLLTHVKANIQPLHVLAAPHIQTMLAADQDGISFLTPGPQRGFLNLLQEAKRLRAQNFKRVLIVNRSFRSALTAFLARIPARVGHVTEGRGFLLTRKVLFDDTKFEGETYGDLARAIGIDGDFSQVGLRVTDSELEAGRTLAHGATFGIQPGASFAEKTLPSAGLIKIANRAIADGRKVCLLGGKEERTFGDAILQGISDQEKVIDLIGQTTLRESMSVLANLSTMVGGSTGIMHIAAALGCPTVTVFGPTLSSRWGHNYEPHRSVQIASGLITDMDPDQVYEMAQEIAR